MKKGNNINLKLPLTKNIKRTHDVHVLNMSFENMESVFGQATTNEKNEMKNKT